MNKFALSLLGLTAIMSIAGCSSTSSNTSGSDKYMVPAEAISLNIRSASLKVGEKVSIETRIRPFAAYDAKLTFKSSDSGVASVNSKGVVSGNAAGHATITVTTSNFEDEEKTPDLIATVEIYVNKSTSEKNMDSLFDEMLDVLEECEEPDNIILYDYRVYDLICDGVSQDRTDERQAYVNSKSRGLMHYNSVEYDVNVTNGGESCEEYGYICETKSSYASYMYHYNSNVKNVFYIATEFNKGKATRFDTMCGILDSYFSVSNDYFTGSYDDILDGDNLKSFSNYGLSKYGFFRNKTEFGIYALLQQADNGTFDAEDECRWATQLPAGIKYRGSLTISYQWVNGYLANMSYFDTKSFTMDGHEYNYNVSLNQTYVVASDEQIARYIPDLSDFNNVDYWYEI